MVLDWWEITKDSLQDLVGGVLNFLPNLGGALLVLIVGWFISVGIGKLVAEVLKRVKFNQLFEKGGWKEALSKAELKVDPSGFVGGIIKWVLVIVFLMAAVEILGFEQFAEFLKSVVLWLPNVVVAVAIFIVAVIIADYLAKLMRAWVEGMKVGYGHFVEVIVKWAIWIFAILAILLQLGIATELTETLFQGIVAFAVIAGGLAFGLGGKDVAAEILQDLHRKLKQ
ncbi:MAG: hypothetical protein CMI54_05045 [Parcubacteria group bacterium]|nr:hypothetical protein [Parcubacteria group bacterium]|tara:strand:+ start:5314 stop:5991 length:678 start_codon:yes stop_codon:yes gene_type:complete